MKLFGTLCSLAFLVSTANAAIIQTNVLIQNTTGTALSSAAAGQSFTTPNDLGGNDILSGFAFIAGANNIGSSSDHLYLFTQAYTGSLAGLSTAGALAEASYNATSKFYDFSSFDITLQADTTYYVYLDGTLSISRNENGTDVYTGGDEYAIDGNGNYAVVPNADLRFQVISTTPAPEPSTLALAGFAVMAVFGVRKYPRLKQALVRR